MWEEPKNNDTVRFENGNEKEINSATLNKLVEFLTSERDLHLEFLDVFLMTYTRMTTPEQLLEKLAQRYEYLYIMTNT
jgi:hypothetical protein